MFFGVDILKIDVQSNIAQIFTYYGKGSSSIGSLAVSL